MSNKTILQGHNKALESLKDIIGIPIVDSSDTTIDGVEVEGKLNLITLGTSDMSISTLPYDMSNGAAVSYEGELHILGGSSSRNHYKWNGTAWTQVSTLPSAVGYATAVVFNDEIHLMYGTNHYKWNGTAWTQVSTLPFSLSYGSAIVFNDELYIATCISYNAVLYKWDGTAWTSLAQVSTSYQYSALAVVFNDKLYVSFPAGGSVGTKLYEFNGSELISVATGGHTSITNNCMVVFDGAIHLIGSGNSDYYVYHDMWDGESFTRLNFLPYSFSYGNAVVHNEYINLVGGSMSKTYHYALDVSNYRKVI